MILDYNDFEIQNLPLSERSKLEQGLCPKCGNGRFITDTPSKGSGDDDVFVCIECKYILGGKTFRPRRAVVQCPEMDISADAAQQFKIGFEQGSEENKTLIRTVAIPLVFASLVLIVQFLFVFVFENNADGRVPAQVEASEQGWYVQAAAMEIASPDEASQEYEYYRTIMYEEDLSEDEARAYESADASAQPPAIPRVPPPPPFPLERNSPYNEELHVMQMQLKLNDLGAYGDETLEIDGRFGPLTQAAVMYFQRLIGVYEDGIMDEELWSRLFMWETP